ncbi:MAG: DUF4116 domain-containing protein [Fibromonadales bacterium]|nr:DUF4116 domain-containing protein [Fibromonadales bacterium]
MCDVLNEEEIDFLTKSLVGKPVAEEEIKTEAQAIEAVKKNGFALCKIPKPLKTAKVCFEAVKQNGSTLQYVPEEFKTAELCLEAVKQSGWYRYNCQPLQYVLDAFKTAELCLEAVKKNGWVLEFVSDRFKTAELCLEAVKQDGVALEFVPEELKTYELCLEAVKSRGFVLRYVPKMHKTENLCREAFKQNIGAYEYIPEAFKSLEPTQRIYNSVFEKTIAEAFEKEFKRVYYRLSYFSECSRREGILALENCLDKEKIAAGDIMEAGVMMCTDGMDKKIIEEYMDSWIEANCTGPLGYYERILASVIKTGVLAVQAGENSTVTKIKLLSKVPVNLMPNVYNIDEKNYFSQARGKL